MDLPGWQAERHAEIRPALLRSCEKLQARPAWRAVCTKASVLADDDAGWRAFLEQDFVPHQLLNADGSATGLVTGYYEPLLMASRTRGGPYRWPIESPPADLITVDLAGLYPQLAGMRLRGRLDGRRLLPYWSRAERSRYPLAPAQVLFWATDPLEVFFLQIQGSGRIALPDGQRARVSYADQNGHPYRSIGRWLVERGEITLDQASMQGIQAWARAHPERLDELINANPSEVFFRELPDGDGPDGPPGALGVALTAGRSIAVDPQSVPLGAPVWLATLMPGRSEALERLVMAQDTGGAIRGGVRADYFFGSGPEAGLSAGRMRAQGRMWALLPRASAP